MTIIRTRLVTYDKPDAEGDVFEKPAVFRGVNPDVSLNFGPRIVGRVLNLLGHSDGIDVVLGLVEGLDPDLVPVFGFSYQDPPIWTGRREISEGIEPKRTYRCVVLKEVSMVKKDRAVLPADFFLCVEPVPPMPTMIQKMRADLKDGKNSG